MLELRFLCSTFTSGASVKSPPNVSMPRIARSGAAGTAEERRWKKGENWKAMAVEDSIGVVVRASSISVSGDSRWMGRCACGRGGLRPCSTPLLEGARRAGILDALND